MVKDRSGTSSALYGGRSVDPRVEALRASVARLNRELAGYPAEWPDRSIAEEELAVLDAETATGAPEAERLRRSLLALAGALGSVSALGSALTEVRRCIELFGGPKLGED